MTRGFRATYRLQLTPEFGFADAQALVPYLAGLGVSHLYLSPSLQARTGSTHGYDVVDPSRLSAELGGENAFRSLAATAADAGLGIVLDIVPNHMAASDENPWWADEDRRAEVFDYDPESGWYRRFFDIDDLAGVRQEDPEVFEATHRKVLELVADGLVDGLRIDHPDGLTDPATYLRNLRGRGVGHVWVEKILQHGERLRDWPVEGTVGYEFLVDADALFVDSGGEAALTEAYGRWSGERRRFVDVATEAQRAEASGTFDREVDQLVTLAAGRADRAEVVDALAGLPVYRTYVEPAADVVDHADRADVAAAGMAPGLTSALLLEGDPFPSRDELVTRFQQTSPPVTAKGTEDTALYRHNRLLALNEVGGDPDRFGLAVGRFHAANQERLVRFPNSLLAGTTHDTKRSADVRARLCVLSGRTDEVVDHIDRWFQLTEDLLTDVDGRAAPDGNERWLVFQTLLGAWPIPADRLELYLEKAVREAKVNTTWVDQDRGWEWAVKRFATGLLDHRPFLDDFEPFATSIAADGESVALGQLLLRLTVPGVPDLYQGDERWNLSLVDPDNRRPVDWAAVQAGLDRVRSTDGPPTPELRKQWLIHRVLSLRGELPGVWAGAYTPLDAGPDVCAFIRGSDDIAVVVSLRPWSRVDLDVALPPGHWADVVPGDLPIRLALNRR